MSGALIVMGLCLAGGGFVALLAGWADLRRVRRLRRDGVMTWALPFKPPLAPGQSVIDPVRPLMLQYALSNGEQMERVAPAPSRRSSLRPGQKVLIWYDPVDPDDVLVYGRWGAASDRGFVIGGTLAIVVGLGLAALS
jgi:hypothetical protein